MSEQALSEAVRMHGESINELRQRIEQIGAEVTSKALALQNKLRETERKATELESMRFLRHVRRFVAMEIRHAAETAQRFADRLESDIPF